MRKQRGPCSLLVLGVLCLAAAVALAQSGGPYDLSWSTVDGGGATASVGGIYALSGTIGQPDAGTLAGGNYSLLGGFWTGGQTITGVGDDGSAESDMLLPMAYRLYAGAPNPFNPSTRIAYDLPWSGRVRLAIYDVRGALVRTLVDEVLPAGHHVSAWDGKDQAGAAVASGTYIFAIDADGFRAQQKGVLLK